MNLKELAASLGLSQTTVSRALNGYPEVGEATRQRVLAAARAADYTPNARARRLATGRTMTIGHVIPTSGQQELVNPIFGDFLVGAGEVYAREGYDLLLSMTTAQDVETAYRRMAAQGVADGIMVQAPQISDSRIALLGELGLPFLVHGRAGEGGYAYLDVANRRAFRRATDLLLDLGHRRIALINGPESLDFAARRRLGMEESMAARGFGINPLWMQDGLMTESFGYRAAREMLAMQPRPTAFLAASIVQAYGVKRAVADAGLRLGREVSLVCHDDMLAYLGNQADSVGGPPITATRSSIRAAGARCAEIMVGMIRHPEAPLVHELWEAELVIGQSTGPAPPEA